MKPFEEYLKEGIIRKITRDKDRSLNLKKEATRKLASLNERIDKIGVRDDNSNEYVEQCYDVIMFLIRSHLFNKGYKSQGIGAHEAEISYLEKLGIGKKDIIFVDKLRYYRNRILYYGRQFDKEYAEKVIDFLNKIYQRLSA